MSQKHHLTIGDIAGRSGLKADALRYYERLGLIAPPRRTPGGFRVYSANVLERLGFIKQAQGSGLTLADIRELLGTDKWRGAAQCRQVQRVLQQKLTEMDGRMAELQRFRRTLKRHMARCTRALSKSADADCPVVVRLKR
jgi:DNA-binding transcriptional MerR regulator